MADLFTIEVVDEHEPHAAESDYVRRFWTPLLGPTATSLLGVLVRDGSRTVTASELANCLGVKHIEPPLERLDLFRLIEWTDDDHIVVGTHLPPLGKLVKKLSPALRAEHDAWTTETRVG